MSTYRSRADQRTAADVSVDQRLMCQANGCPNRWTVDTGSRICSAHFHAEPHTWPQVTQEQQWHETERARLGGEPRHEKRYALMTAAQKRAVVQRWQVAMQEAQKNPRAWIDRLVEAEQGGHTLSPAQRHALAQIRMPVEVEA